MSERVPVVVSPSPRQTDGAKVTNDAYSPNRSRQVLTGAR